jgi:hypothetical protein
MKDVFDKNEVQAVLEDRFYRAKDAPKARRTKAKPDHYEIICISMYKTDLARLDAMVRSLKVAGHRKMNRSALIRFALDNIDVGQLPRSY